MLGQQPGQQSRIHPIFTHIDHGNLMTVSLNLFQGFAAAVTIFQSIKCHIHYQHPLTQNAGFAALLSACYR